MKQIGKDVFLNPSVVHEKIEITKQSLQLTQHLKCGNKFLVIINILSASNLDHCHAWLHLYNNATEKWDKAIDLDRQLMVTPANMNYEEYTKRFGDIISSTEHPKYFKAILSVMATDRSTLLRMIHQKFS